MYYLNVAMNKKHTKNKKTVRYIDSFFFLIKKRTKLVDLVIKNKEFKKDIVDKKRIKIILKI